MTIAAALRSGSELAVARASRDSVQARQAKLAERQFSLEAEKIAVRDQAVTALAGQDGNADELLDRLEALETELGRLNRMRPIVQRALEIAQHRATEAERGAIESRSRPQTIGGKILPRSGEWAGQ